MNSDRPPGTGIATPPFFFYFLVQPMEGVVREGSRIEGLDSLRRYVKSKNASLRREKAGKKGDDCSLVQSVFRIRPSSPFESRFPFFPSSSSSSPSLGRIRFADPFDG